MRVGSVACVASHSALDVFDGAKDEGFRTVAVCRRGRDAIYKALPELIDHYIDLEDYREMLSEPVQRRLLELESVVVPNRSMAVYVGYEGIERSLRVPFFGNRMMLRWEERTGEKNYYRLLDEAGVSRPKTFSGIEEVDRPVVLKVQEAERTQERAFIVATDGDDLRRKVRRALEAGTISEATLRSAVIEELLLGAHFNVNFFLSRVRRRLEIVSVDRRVQSDLDGYLRLTAREQLELGKEPSMIEVGHEPATLRESLLNQIYEMGKRVVEASARLEPPGLIGPFTLQLMVLPDLRSVVYDFAPRIGGGTNAHMGIGGNYSKLFLRRAVSMGRRICIELREAQEQGMLEEVLT
jgi:5-formaminoimidazole-4-carboxamide-1-(beta)-D-ribofuranosyl 5'-monophosphate synthetase